MGDVHGHLETVLPFLRDAGLIDRSNRWTGNDARLVWIGDLFDRGPDGIATLDLVRSLQQEAPRAGGSAAAVLGNHDLLIMTAARHPQARDLEGRTWMDHHDDSGGSAAERRALGADRWEWLAGLPAMLRLDDTLFVHADVIGYLGWGRSTTEANATVRACLAGGRPEVLDALMVAMGFHHAFDGPSGERVVARFRRTYGVERIVHGHTPLQKNGVAKPTEPRIYQGGRVINVDGGIYKGGPGFLWEMTPTLD